MTNFKLDISINGETYTDTQLARYKYERALHFLHEVIDLGYPLTDQQQPLSAIAINWLSPEKIMQLAIATHRELGPEGTLELFKEVLMDSDKRWHEFNQTPIEEQGCWVGTTHIKATGIQLQDFSKAMGSIQIGDLPFQIMPEHYYVNGDISKEQQVIMETFGMFGEPTLSYGTASQDIPAYVPVERLTDHPLIMAGETLLKHDDFNIHVGAIHQIAPTTEGLDIVSSFFCPKAAPKAIADGHTLHFALELGGMLEAAAQKAAEL